MLAEASISCHKYSLITDSNSDVGVVGKEGKTKVNMSSVKLDHLKKVWA